MIRFRTIPGTARDPNLASERIPKKPTPTQIGTDPNQHATLRASARMR